MSFSSEALDALKQKLSAQAQIVTPQSENYSTLLRRWAASAEKPAALIILPTDAHDVSIALSFARDNKLDLAIKGGGHASSGASSSDGGLVIDLSLIKAVTVDAEKKIATVGGGARWEDVDVATAKHGLACVGGTVNDTGVGGLALGGGFGVLTGDYGCVVDNFLEAEVVLASGEIVKASHDENSDLFWAIRGAGHMFGVVIEFVFKAHEIPPIVWGGLTMYPREQLPAVLKFVNRNITLDTGIAPMMVGLLAPLPARQPVMIIAVTYLGSEAEAISHYAEFLAIPSLMQDVKARPYPELNEMLNGQAEYGYRRVMKGSSFLPPLTVDYAESLFDDLLDFHKRVPDAANSAILLEWINPRKNMLVGQRDTAFPNRGKLLNFAIGTTWTDPANDTVCREWAREMGAKGRREVEKSQRGDDVDAVTKEGSAEYVNYDFGDSTAKALYGVNYPRLRELKLKYDPTNIFSKGPNFLA